MDTSFDVSLLQASLPPVNAPKVYNEILNDMLQVLSDYNGGYGMDEQQLISEVAELSNYGSFSASYRATISEVIRSQLSDRHGLIVRLLTNYGPIAVRKQITDVLTTYGELRFQRHQHHLDDLDRVSLTKLVETIWDNDGSDYYCSPITILSGIQSLVQIGCFQIDHEMFVRSITEAHGLPITSCTQ